MEEFKIRHEVEGRGGLRAAPPDPPPEHGGILKPICLRDATQGQKNINILRGKKDATTFSRQAYFVNRFTLHTFSTPPPPPAIIKGVLAPLTTNVPPPPPEE